MTVGAIVLAAGSARRMGADKLTADLDGRLLIDHVLAAIAAAGLPTPIVAIPAGKAGPAASALVVEVADHALGMGHSLRAAIPHVPSDWTAAIICLADMPFVRPATLSALVAQAAADRIVRPTYEGEAGNPLLWGRAFFAELAALAGDRGGRAILARHADSVTMLACDDPGILIDIDTPADLVAARSKIAEDLRGAG